MDVEWDSAKAKANFDKHGIAFADAVAVFYDERALTVQDVDPDEQRFITVGMDPLARVLVVVYTWRGDSIRIISARQAGRRERRQYEEDR